MRSERLHSEAKPLADFPTLTWQELIYLHDNKLSLRSVDDEKQAAQEKDNGGRGDAVSLATFAFPGAEGLEIRERVKSLYGLQEDQEGLYSKSLLLNAYYFLRSEEIMRDYPQDKELLQQRLLDGIETHVMIAMRCFGSRAFLLIDRGFNAETPYDFERYPLGKCGTASFKAHQVKAMITADRQAPWNEQSAYRAILMTIKKLCHAYQPDYQSARALPALSLLKSRSSAHPGLTPEDKGLPKKRCSSCIIL